MRYASCTRCPYVRLRSCFALERSAGGPNRSPLHNGGAAFSPGNGVTCPLITPAVVGWSVWTATPLQSLPWAVSLGLVSGSASGNVVDRLFHAPGLFRGHVVDMISTVTP